MRLSAFFRFQLFLLLLFLVFSTKVRAQQTATLRGNVTDSSGANIPGAEVTARSTSSAAIAAQAKTGPDGKCSLTLPPGRYRVSITHPNFARVEQEFVLSAGEQKEWSVRLQLETLSSSVVVTAEAEPTLEENSPLAVDVITREQIEQRGEIWLGSILTTAPGTALTRLGPEGGINTFFLDGGNSNFTKVLIDGASVNQPGGDIDFSNFDIANVDKVEIVHGASSALLGSDAMTGVVQIFTHRGSTQRPILTLAGEGGTFQTGRGSGQLSGLLGAFDYSLSAAHFDTNGQGPNDRFRVTGLSGNFGWRFSDTDALRLSLRSDASDAGQPGQTLLQAPDLDQHSDLHNFESSLSWDFATGAHWQHRLQGTEARIQQFFADPDDFNAANKFNRAGFEEQSSYLFRNGGVSLGYNYEVENGTPNGPQERRNNQAGYAETRYQFGRRVTATAGARAEANDSFGTRVVPRAGLAYAARFGDGFWGATRLRFSFGEGIKEPTFIQSFENDPCFPGNPNLRPERSHTYDAGVDQLLAHDRLRLSVNYFHNFFYDVVSFSFNPTPTSTCPFGTGTFFNTDKARARGANASFEAKAARWLRISGNYTYDDTRVLKAPNAFDPTLSPGNRLFRRPLHSANLVFNSALWRMNWNLAGIYVGRRTDSDFLGLGVTSNPSYVRWDLATNYRFSRGISALARVENLFDRRYQDAVGYSALGLNYRLGLKYTWGGNSK